jgi:hypothetical protein
MRSTAELAPSSRPPPPAGRAAATEPLAEKESPARSSGARSCAHCCARKTRWLAVSSGRCQWSTGSIETGTRLRHVASSRASNFPAETLGAGTPASIARPACSCTRYVVPDSPNKSAAVVTRARVDPRVSVFESPPVLSGLRASPYTAGQTASVQNSFSGRHLPSNILLIPGAHYHVAICRQSGSFAARPGGRRNGEGRARGARVTSRAGQGW